MSTTHPCGSIPILESSVLVSRDIPPALVGKIHWIDWCLFCDRLDEALQPLRTLLLAQKEHKKSLFSSSTKARQQKVKSKVLTNIQRVCDIEAKKLSALHEFILYCPWESTLKGSRDNISIANWHIQVLVNNSTPVSILDVPFSISFPSADGRDGFSVQEDLRSAAMELPTQTNLTSQARIPSDQRIRNQSSEEQNIRPPPVVFPEPSISAASSSSPVRRVHSFSFIGRTNNRKKNKNSIRRFSVGGCRAMLRRRRSSSSNTHNQSNNSRPSVPLQNVKQGNPSQGRIPIPIQQRQSRNVSRASSSSSSLASTLSIAAQQEDEANLTNPFIDDPRDTFAMSRDAFFELDRQLEEEQQMEQAEWMSAPTLGGNYHGSDVPIPMAPPNAVPTTKVV